MPCASRSDVSARQAQNSTNSSRRMSPAYAVQSSHNDLLEVAPRTPERLRLGPAVDLDEVSVGHPELQHLTCTIVPAESGELVAATAAIKVSVSATT